MKSVIVIPGASSGFGALAARVLAQAGHTVSRQHARDFRPQCTAG
jgi:NADP-dependent 3-hydroxy acid dehydrogenase YdfG